MRARRRAWPRRLLAAALLAAVVVGLLPPARARVKAVPALLNAVGVAAPRPLAPPVRRRAVQLGKVAGDLYAPAGRMPGIVLVPGATRAGLADLRVVRTATALARSGRAVFVPDLALYRGELVLADIDRVRTATRELAERTSGPVGLVGFSYGGALALLAAEGRSAADVVQVALFGAYFDLVGVVQAATTGVALVGDRRLPWDPDPRAGEVLVEVLGRLAPPGEGDDLSAAVEGTRPPDGLSPQARSLYDVVVNNDPHRTRALVARLPPDVRELLDRFSPATVADRIDVPVIAVHARDDPAVPYAEALRLQVALPQARLLTVHAFRHVNLTVAPGEWLGTAADIVRAWRFVAWVLAPQEPWRPALRGLPSPAKADKQPYVNRRLRGVAGVSDGLWSDTEMSACAHLCDTLADLALNQRTPVGHARRTPERVRGRHSLSLTHPFRRSSGMRPLSDVAPRGG